MKWILGTERLPETGKSVYCRKSYYADKSGTGRTIMTIGKRNKNGELSVIERYPATWEWLDENESTKEMDAVTATPIIEITSNKIQSEVNEMSLESQGNFLKIIEDDFTGMKNMLDHVREKITQYPVFTQLAFIKPLKNMIFEAWQDAIDENNEFLNNYDGGDIVVVCN